MSQEEIQAVAQEIASALGETESKPCAQIAAIIQHCGIEFAQTLLHETQDIESQGGMMLQNESRRRTAGGVFFHLARRRMSRETAKVIFPGYYGGGEPANKKSKSGRSTLPLFNWRERTQILQPLLDEKGVLTTVKVTLIGRPGRVDSSHKDLIITTMSHVAKSASFPKGVPQPPDKPTLYTVYIAVKQWRKVEEAIADPNDALIIEGVCAFDDQIGGIAVFATSVTSKQLEAQKQQTQKQSRGESDTMAAVAPTEPSNAKAKKGFEPTQPAPLTLPNLPNAPTDALQKLTELYASASLFRQKIATIQSKPAGQQFGLEMTQKLLKNVEDEIAVLEKKYQE